MDKKPEKLVPEVRFKGFTDDWEQRKLGEISKRVRNNDGRMNLPLLTISARYGWMTQQSRFSASIAGREKKNYTLLKKHQLSYNHGNSKVANYGTVYELTDYDEALVPKVYHSFSLTSENSSKFIESYFHTKKLDAQLRKFIASTARMDGLLNISFDDFMKVKLFAPERCEQSKISRIINLIEKLITLQQRKLEQLKQLKKAMLQYLLTTEKKSAPLIRNKNYNNKWDTTTFSKLLNYERPENYIVTNTNYRKNGIPVLTANKSFILGYTNESNVYNKGEAIIFDDFTLENKFVNFPFMIKSSAIKILTSKVNYSLYFIFQLLQHTKFIKEGHARHYISVVQKQTVRIPPSYEEQESISDTFSRIQSLIKLQQNKIDQYTTLKKYLLQKIFI
ncbi:restriction endonuclease subunit S [Limosilactobacillus reuteri]|uniref:restriction endonuclease subunit S n=2 Tax=Limosilactobacillus reuteri TaxID=1598 RepID=UPI00129A8D40|nr:restriction endonuclease subunit S [Limosilactobacillus reuteri]MCC4331724.1 restriction endonuclease subunit S [Limosilactobacillus reuteri]MDY5593949.1 restriction endonuclease subunit S [Limosilactobacillus reuteri]MRI03329.1 restriction endonuclease subunit S [Limosilactobacillus reuteri]